MTMTRACLMLLMIIALIACGASATPRMPGAIAPEAAAAQTPPTVVLPSATSGPPSATAASPSLPPSATAAVAATSAPQSAPAAATAAASPTAPLFLDPTVTPGAAPSATPAPAGSAGQPIAAPAAQPASAQAATTGKPVRLVIDGIDLDRTLVPVGLDASRIPVVPDHDIGWYTLSAQPGQGENVVLWGHVLRFKRTPNIPAPFARLKDIAKGDRVTLYDAQGASYRYVVTQQVWATPDQVEYMLPRGQEQVTLISCIGDKVIQDGTVEMTNRLITIAEPETR